MMEYYAVPLFIRSINDTPCYDTIKEIMVKLSNAFIRLIGLS